MLILMRWKLCPQLKKTQKTLMSSVQESYKQVCVYFRGKINWTIEEYSSWSLCPFTSSNEECPHNLQKVLRNAHISTEFCTFSSQVIPNTSSIISKASHVIMAENLLKLPESKSINNKKLSNWLFVALFRTPKFVFHTRTELKVLSHENPPWFPL